MTVSRGRPGSTAPLAAVALPLSLWPRLELDKSVWRAEGTGDAFSSSRDAGVGRKNWRSIVGGPALFPVADLVS